ncbi:MAG: Uncharacterised protein [Pseudidiomarina mangrovi]|nr:MAG: Uncharacterised protein [Pseudidiomarina mangrovi]
MNKLIIATICILLVSCEYHFKLDNTHILAWVNDNSELLNEVSDAAKKLHIDADIHTVEDIQNMNVLYAYGADAERVRNTIMRLFNSIDYPAKSIFFHFGKKSTHKSIYISLYNSGFCAAFSDCVNTSLVFYDSKSLIYEHYSYHYFETNLEGWYILKVTEQKDI